MKQIICLIAIFCVCLTSKGQFVEQKKGKTSNSSNSLSEAPLSDRLFLTGGFGFSLGNNISSISLSPTVGYRITERFSAGPGINYQFVNIRDFRSFHSVGYQAFGQYLFTENIFAQVYFENINYEVISRSAIEDGTRRWQEGLFAGVGYFYPLGDRGGIQILGLYNLLWQQPHPFYSRPWDVRIGFVFGLFSLN